MPVFAVVFVVIAIPLLVLIVTLNLRSDRMVYTKHRDYLDVNWVGLVGNLTWCEAFDVGGLTGDPLAIARQAIRAAGGNRIEVLGDVILAWVPASLPYSASQVGIRVQTLPNNIVHFECCSRPRYSIAMTDLGRGRKLVAKIRSQITPIMKSN
jgi:hypothetical protein